MRLDSRSQHSVVHKAAPLSYTPLGGAVSGIRIGKHVVQRVSPGGSLSGEPKPRVLWGVPKQPDHFVEHPSLFARFEAWHRGSTVLVIAAPDGHGKSSMLASWLRSRDSTEPVLWISSGGWITTRSDVWKTMIDAMVETGVLPSGNLPTALRDPTTFAALQNMKQPIVVVFDDLDKSSLALDLDYLARVAHQIPLVRAIAIISRLEIGQLTNPVDPLVLGAAELAWDSSMVDIAYSGRLGIELPADRAQSIIDATGGRAESVERLITLQQTDASLRAVPGGRPSREVLFDSSLAALLQRDVSGADSRALAVIALSLRAPRELIGAAGEQSGAAFIPDRLLDAGLIAQVDTNNGGVSFEVPEAQRALAESWASDYLGEAAGDVHRAGVRHNLRDNPALVIRHLALLGEFDEALSLVKKRWWDVGGTVQVSELRSALALVPEAHYRVDVEALAICLLVDRLPATDRSKRVDLEAWLVKESPRILGALPANGGFLVTAAILWAVLSQGRSREAIELALDVARRVGDQQWAAETDQSAELSVLVNGAAEVLLSAGMAEQALPLIRLADDLVVGSPSAFAHFRTATLGAVAHAFDGDWDGAAVLVNRAEATYSAEGWPRAQVEYTTIVAKALIAHAQLDADGMATAASWFDVFARDDKGWRAAGRLSRAYALLYAGQPAASLAMLRQFTHRLELIDSPVPAALAAALGADLWVATARPGQAVDLLANAESSADHTMCFAVQRASARLALGQPRLALSETDDCLRLGSKHSLQTLPGVLIRRAIAHEMLGHSAAADEQFLEFLLLLQQAKVRSPLLNLVRSPLEALIARAVRDNPSLVDILTDFSAVVDDLAPLLRPDPSATLLSERERRVLELMATGATVSGIASSLFVSPNTVKSQISSIYRKLGISTRAQAADAAASMGLISG